MSTHSRSIHSLLHTVTNQHLDPLFLPFQPGFGSIQLPPLHEGFSQMVFSVFEAVSLLSTLYGTVCERILLRIRVSPPQNLLIDLFPVGQVAFLRDFETGELHASAVDLSAGFHHMPKLLD